MVNFIKNPDNLRDNIIFSYLAIIAVFILDIVTPPDLAVWLLYLIPVLMIPYKSIRKSYIYSVSLVISVLIWIHYFLQTPVNIQSQHEADNRAVMTCILWLVTYVQVQRANSFTRLSNSEEALKLERSKLKESESKLLDAQKLARIGNYTIDFKNNGAMEWSDEMYNIWEVDKSKPLPTVDEAWKLVHPDDWDELNRVLTHKSPGSERVETEFRIVFPGGRIKYVHIITRVLFDESGNLSKREGVEMDITERKLSQIRLERTLQELARSNKELEQFAYIASHDLQEPLRMVSSYTKLLEHRYKDQLDEKAKQYIHFASDGSKRMSELVRDLLTYSRVTSKEKEYEETDLNGIFNTVINDIQVLIKEAHARVSSSNLPSIYCDPTQIKQLIQNLTVNAIKFHGEREPEVYLESQKTKDGWLFSVTDNGIGIDPDHYERIFHIFQRLHEKERYPGTGIGLALCKKIVERHGGRIWVESSPGRGTKFYFTIPGQSTLKHSYKNNGGVEIK